MPAPALEAYQNGAVAQLGEQLLCKHQVVGSIPSSSTILPLPLRVEGRMDGSFLSGKQSLQRAGAKIPSDAKPTSFRGNVTVAAARAGLAPVMFGKHKVTVLERGR